MKGNISVLRYSSTSTMKIELRDESSGVRFLEVELTAEDLMLALSGRSEMDCKFELKYVESIGKLREYKEEIVPIPTMGVRVSDEAIIRALEPFEVDGWSARREDAKNHHRFVEYSAEYSLYRVSFTRFVDQPAPEMPTTEGGE